MIKQYVKKSIVIEALQTRLGMDLSKIREFTGSENVFQDENLVAYIKTLEGAMKITPGDYIIKGIKGEFYPCKADIFKETYTEI